MKFLRRLFGWFTIISLMLWAGVAAYIVMVQHKDVAPVGWPATYSECVTRWSVPEGDAAKAEQIKTRCADYYALLGDRDAPILKRLQQQVQGRMTESVIDAYLTLEPPAPGEVVTGAQVVAKLGSERILRMFYALITEAEDPPSIQRRAQLRCMLEETRRPGPVVDPAYITQGCMRR